MMARRLHADLAEGLAATTCPQCESVVVWKVPDRPTCSLCGWEMPKDWWNPQRAHKKGRHKTP